MTIGFVDRGIYVIVYGAIVSRHNNSILSSIKIKIQKENNCIYNLESDLFLNPYTQWYSDKSLTLDFNSIIPAHQIYLSNEQPLLYKIQFIDYDIEKKTKHYINESNRDSLLVQCKLETGKYDLIFELKDINDKVYKSKYFIELTEDQIKLLQKNVDQILNNQTPNQNITLPLIKV